MCVRARSGVPSGMIVGGMRPGDIKTVQDEFAKGVTNVRCSVVVPAPYCALMDF
jgi:hypothetical protein